MYAFLSYPTADRQSANQVREILDGFGIRCFLAHNDIQVSEEWRHRIIEEIGKVDLFVAIISRRYAESAWCMQESGIAAFRSGVTIIPLSLDDTPSLGFISHIQSVRVQPEQIVRSNLLPGLARVDPASIIDPLIGEVERSGTFRQAEANFREILPLLGSATTDQIVRLLDVSAKNGQVLYAHLVSREYLPPLMARFGHLLNDEVRQKLQAELPGGAA